MRVAKEGGTKGNLGSIRSALSVYYADTEGQYPGGLFGLTIGGTYLTKLPDADIPPYHPRSAAVSAGSGTAGINDGGGWAYSSDASRTEAGSVWVNCTHTDSKGSRWSSY